MALARGCTVQEAAQESGAGVRTIKLWSSEVPAFSRRVADLRLEMTERSLGKLVDGMAEAADTLRDLLKARSESVKLNACKALLELGTRLREDVELERRVSALESGRRRKPA